jgi:hypothetical protein
VREFYAGVVSAKVHNNIKKESWNVAIRQMFELTDEAAAEIARDSITDLDVLIEKANRTLQYAG